jgi:putative hydrolase of the HAD superfamily
VIRCVAFDLDGVVLPSHPSFDWFEREHGITRAKWQELFSSRAFERANVGEGDLHTLLPPFLERWGWRLGAEHFTRAWFDSCRQHDAEVAALIAQLRASGIQCVAATNQEARRARELESHAPLRRLFDRAFYSCQLGVGKPDAAYFRAIERALGLVAHELLFLDDKPLNVAGARACGWAAEVATSADSVRSALGAHLGRIIVPA